MPGATVPRLPATEASGHPEGPFTTKPRNDNESRLRVSEAGHINGLRARSTGAEDDAAAAAAMLVG